MSPQQKFRIVWKCLLTNKEGHGSYCFFSKIKADDFAFHLNTKMPGIFHWVEKK